MVVKPTSLRRIDNAPPDCVTCRRRNALRPNSGVGPYTGIRMSLLRKLIFLLILAAVCLNAYATARKAYFGFATDATTSGSFLNPKLERAWVKKVSLGSPAENAGLLVGDVILVANEKNISGSSAKDFFSLLRSFEPGDHLRLEVERSGKPMIIDIVAGSK